MSEPALVSGQMRYVLVVDSDWNDRFTLSMLLQRFGYTVASTSSAQEAVEFLCVAPAVAVFAEGGPTGTELASRLRSDARFRDMPIILAMNGKDPVLEEQLRRGELSGILRMPLNPDEVYLVIQKAIEKGPRENIRIPTALSAQLRSGDSVTDGYVTVLSQYGLFFRTLDPLPVRTRAEIGISFGDRTVNLLAEVLYVVSFEEGPFCEPGMGMKFVGIAQSDSALIRFFIEEQLGAKVIAFGPPSGQA